MKVTRFGQSCMLLEKNAKRLLIDPGLFFSQKHSLDELGSLDGVLFTHQHQDHLDESLLPALREAKICLYGNPDVCQKVGEGSCKVADGAGFSVAGFDIVPRDLPHCLLPDGSDGPPNTGFVVDGHFFHPGDGVKISGLQVSDLAAPILGPSISPRDAISLAESVEAKKIIPIHFDMFGANPAAFKQWYDGMIGEAEVILLADGESTEL